MSAAVAPGRPARRALALGLLHGMNRCVFRVNGREVSVFVRAGMDRDAFERTLPQYPSGQWHLKFPPGARKGLFRDYLAPMIELAEEAGHDAPFLVHAGDNTRSLPAPAFVRARRIGHPGLGILQRFRSHNHTPDTMEMTKADKLFIDKVDQLVWRGATTGRFVSPRGEQLWSSRYHIMDAQERIADPRIDLGYSSVVQTSGMPGPLLQRVYRTVRPNLPWEAMLGARFVLLLEGNDVATALPWVLHANTCPLMPTPLFESWLCEGALRRSVHYIPVAPDLNDLEAQFNACVADTSLCETIAGHGRQFMAPFHDDEAEHALALEVAKAAFRKVKYVPGQKAVLPDELF